MSKKSRRRSPKKYSKRSPKKYSKISPKKYSKISPKKYSKISPKKYSKRSPKQFYKTSRKQNESNIPDDKFIKNIITKFPFHEIINIFMVYKGYRRATYIEKNNESYHTIDKIVNELIQKLGLKTIVNSINNIMVYKTPIKDVNMNDEGNNGYILGYYCHDKYPYNKDVNKIKNSILAEYNGKKIDLYAEVCETSLTDINELKKHIDNMTEKYKKLLPYMKVYSVMKQEETFSVRKEAIIKKDTNKINKYWNNIVNDIENIIGYKDLINAVKEPYDEKNLPVLIFIYEYKDFIDKLFPEYTGSNKNEIDKIGFQLYTLFNKNLKHEDMYSELNKLKETTYFYDNT